MGKSYQPRIVHLANLCFKNERETREYSDDGILYTAKLNESLSHEKTWMNLKCILLRKPIRNSEKGNTMEIIKRPMVAEVGVRWSTENFGGREHLGNFYILLLILL